MASLSSARSEDPDTLNDLRELMSRSETFYQNIRFHSRFNSRLENRISHLYQIDRVNPEEIVRFAETTYCIFDESVRTIAHQFLDVKRRFGSFVEKDLYASMTVDMFLCRLLIQRPAAFFGSNDTFMFRNCVDGHLNFELI